MNWKCHLFWAQSLEHCHEQEENPHSLSAGFRNSLFLWSTFHKLNIIVRKPINFSFAFSIWFFIFKKLQGKIHCKTLAHHMSFKMYYTYMCQLSSVPLDNKLYLALRKSILYSSDSLNRGPPDVPALQFLSALAMLAEGAGGHCSLWPSGGPQFGNHQRLRASISFRNTNKPTLSPRRPLQSLLHHLNHSPTSTRYTVEKCTHG